MMGDENVMNVIPWRNYYVTLLASSFWAFSSPSKVSYSFDVDICFYRFQKYYYVTIKKYVLDAVPWFGIYWTIWDDRIDLRLEAFLNFEHMLNLIIWYMSILSSRDLFQWPTGYISIDSSFRRIKFQNRFYQNLFFGFYHQASY